MITTSDNPQAYRKDKVNEINEFIDKMPTEDENLKEKTRRWLFKNLLQDPLIQEAQKERRLDRMTSLTPEKLERMNQLFLQEEFENAKEKAQAFVYETEEEYDARVNQTIAKMEEQFEKKKENLSESELKLIQGYGDVEYWKIVKYKEQARKNKEYINDPNLQKCLIEIENPIQRFFSVTETHTQNNTKKYRETIMSLPSAYKWGNESVKYKNLFSKENDKEDDEYGSRDVSRSVVARWYLQVDPIGKTITLISDNKYNIPYDISHVSYLLEKKFPWYAIDTVKIPERNHNNYRGILNPNQYFENAVCDGSLKDYELLWNYLKMADSSLIKDTRGYAFWDFTYNLFSEAYVNVLEKSLSNDPDWKELLKLKEKSINEIKEEYPSECKDFEAKVRNIEIKYQNSINAGDYTRALIIDKAKSLNKTNDIKLIDVFNECMNIATEKYGRGKIG